MTKQRPQTIAELDKKRGKAALALRVAQRELLTRIKKQTLIGESPGSVEQEQQNAGVGVVGDGVTGGLRSRVGEET